MVTIDRGIAFDPNPYSTNENPQFGHAVLTSIGQIEDQTGGADPNICNEGLLCAVQRLDLPPFNRRGSLRHRPAPHAALLGI
jgi:hypothetical protein